MSAACYLASAYQILCKLVRSPQTYDVISVFKISKPLFQSCRPNSMNIQDSTSKTVAQHLPQWWRLVLLCVCSNRCGCVFVCLCRTRLVTTLWCLECRLYHIWAVYGIHSFSGRPALSFFNLIVQQCTQLFCIQWGCGVIEPDTGSLLHSFKAGLDKPRYARPCLAGRHILISHYGFQNLYSEWQYADINPWGGKGVNWLSARVPECQKVKM